MNRHVEWGETWGEIDEGWKRFRGRFERSAIESEQTPKWLKQARWIEAKALRVFMALVAWQTPDWH